MNNKFNFRKENIFNFWCFYLFSDVADDAGRPVEAVADDYDGKTTFEEVQNTNEVPDSVDQTTTGLLPRCFNGVGTNAATWYAAGSWTRCDGEIEACEIKASSFKEHLAYTLLSSLIQLVVRWVHLIFSSF